MSNDQKRASKTADFPPVKKVLIIQGSPRKKKGWTDHCLNYLIQGLEQGGAQCETVYVRDLKIKPCVGCFTCWEKTPGVCVHKGDDMPAMLEKMTGADLWVFASPLYYFSLPGIAKNYLDRCLPLAQPFINQDPSTGRSTHPSRYEGNVRVALLSVCGFPEVEHFGALTDMFRRVFNMGGTGSYLVAELLRPAAEALPNRQFFEDRYQTSMDALVRAGRELTGQGWVSQAAEQAVQTPFFDDNTMFTQMANLYWKASISYNDALNKGREMPPFEEYFVQYMADNPPA